MDQPVSPGRLVWQEAAVAAVTRLTPRVKSFFLKPPEWHGFRAGQHVDVRLSAPDGYMAERSYSIGSPPEATTRFRSGMRRKASTIRSTRLIPVRGIVINE